MLYLEHFKLTKAPFSLTPDPEFVYWSKQHARAKAYMESTIWLSDGFVVITGEIGSGKTTLLQSFLGEFDDDIVFAVVSQTQLTPTQFLQAILTEFGFKPFDKKKVELLDMLNMFLIEQYSAGKKVILIVDEAQNLTARVLEEIRLLSGVETSKEKVLRIVLAGQPELKDVLDSDKLKQLVQRVRLRFHLGALDDLDTQAYIEHRLRVAGLDENKIFDEDCYKVIYRYSGGIPRLINTLCDSTLLIAYGEDRDHVEPLDVELTAEELGWDVHKDTTGSHLAMPHLITEQSEKEFLTRIVVRHEGEQVDEFFLPAGRAIVGRSPDSEIYIDSKFISRHHAQFVSDESGCVVEDLNSTNGILIDDESIKKQRLSDGDIVSIGVHEIAYYDLHSEDGSEQDADEAAVSEA
jgi:general secretion pathway protein A